MERSWILVGMMGAGKSSIASALARRTGRGLVDTDKLIEHRLGRSIPQLFRVYGEEAFRAHETAILRDLQPGHTVISTGGGIVLRPENWLELRRLGTVLYLNVDESVLQQRVGGGRRRRPLLDHEDWEERLAQLLLARRSLYEQADLHLEVGTMGVEETVERVQEMFEGAS